MGVDVNEAKINMIKAGRPPVIELGLGELLSAGVKAGRITATASAAEAVANSDVSLISVGTPSQGNGAMDLRFVMKVCREIGEAIAAKGSSHVVVVRSTVLPGTTRRCTAILKEAAHDVPVHLAVNPEFLREGSAIKDYDSPPYTIIGSEDKLAEKALRDMYATVTAPVFVTSLEAAELIKFAANAWHATKISFANEIGRLSKNLGVDGLEVMDILTKDTKLNISTAYLRPGFAYGGSCLPKDVRALTYIGKTENIDLPLLSALETSNRAQIDLATNLILRTGKKRVGLLGLAFKFGTDDLRESPSVELAERLIGKGCDVAILDSAVSEACLFGANREFIEHRIPHLSRLLVKTSDELIGRSDIIVASHGAAEFREVLSKIGEETPVIDLAGIIRLSSNGRTYEGIAW
jgi:GDP-mannose 6-dehydrogenase